MALVFAFAEALKDCKPEIIATDADSHLLARASRACYAPSSLRELPQTWRVAFGQTGERYCLRQAYRAPVRFLEQDIREHLPAGPFDLILCRNLLFTYFEAQLQAAIAKRLAELLVPGGFLLLGIHESLPEPIPALVSERPWLYHR